MTETTRDYPLTVAEAAAAVTALRFMLRFIDPEREEDELRDATTAALQKIDSIASKGAPS